MGSLPACLLQATAQHAVLRHRLLPALLLGLDCTLQLCDLMDQVGILAVSAAQLSDVQVHGLDLLLVATH